MFCRTCHVPGILGYFKSCVLMSALLGIDAMDTSGIPSIIPCEGEKAHVTGGREVCRVVCG